MNDCGRQKESKATPYLPLLHFKNAILNCVGNDNTLDKDFSHLAHSVDTIESLGLNSKRPTEVE